MNKEINNESVKQKLDSTKLDNDKLDNDELDSHKLDSNRLIILLKSFIVSLSMYTSIPMPNIQWKDEYLKYIFYYLPIIGLLIGFFQVGIYTFANYMDLTPNLYSALALIIVILITGGIHFDGYMDLSDAINSHKDIEDRIKILKDPHVGSFAVLYSILYFIVLYSVFIEIYSQNKNYEYVIFISSFFIPRVVANILISKMNSMKKEGFLYTIQKNSNKKILFIVSILYLTISILFIGIFSNMVLALLILIVVICSILLLYNYFHKVYHGISGDMAGFTITIMEVITLIIFAIYGAGPWY